MKLRNGLWFCLLLLTLLGTTPVFATEPESVIITLPAEASISSARMLLGEIAELTGPTDLVAAVAAVNTGSAPAGGSPRTLTKGQIEVRLRQAGIDLSLVQFKGASAVRVYRGSELQKSSASGQKGSNTYAVVVAARDLVRGDVIQAGDLQMEELELRPNQVDGRPLESFIGLRATRTIRAGTPLSTLNVEVIPVIERGDSVTIMVQVGGLVVTAPGIARGSGGVGDIISVENTVSRQIVQAEISDGETVQVNMRGSQAP